MYYLGLIISLTLFNIKMQEIRDIGLDCLTIV